MNDGITVKTIEHTIVYKEPETITPKNVQYYCEHAKELKHTQIHKARKFVQFDCIEYVGNNQFAVHNLKGYNSNMYFIVQSKAYPNTFECSCQGWQTKHKKGEIIEEGANCSHVLALFFCFKMKKFQKQKQEMVI